MRTKILGYWLGLMLAGLAVANLAWAQPGGSMGGASFQDQFQSIKRTQMGPELGINQQTVDRLLQIEQRYRVMRQNLIRDSKNDFQRLQQVMHQPTPSDAEVKAILSDIKRKQQEMQSLQQRQGEEEEALLTPVQMARYIMYQKKMLQDARSVKGRGPGETMPYTPSSPREIPVSRPAGPPR